MTAVDAGCGGLIGCECVGGACTTGECLAGSCVDCRRGEAACICRANSTCNAGLRCTTGGQCESCPAGDMGCACGTGDTCGTGLICASAVCVTDTCVAGTVGCPCRTGATGCDNPLYCDGMSLCRTCSNDVVGCPCSGGVCAGGTVCDSTTQACRAPVTCAQLAANGTCVANQACAEGTNGADATCTAMTCLPEFKWNGISACVACVSAGCTNEPTCSDLDGGLGSMCETQHRSCTALTSTCGACLAGYAQNPSGTCVAVPTCGGATCSYDQYCNTASGTPTCTMIPCPAGQGVYNGACKACAPNPTCTGTVGFSGRPWPIMAGDGVCLCETLDNYFMVSGGFFTATACDLDGDGWVREEAGDQGQQLPAYGANMRCNITSVDRVRLYDEYGISVDVLSCTEGLVKASTGLPDGGTPNGGLPLLADGGLMQPVRADGGIPCSGFVPLRLLETARNDIPGNPVAPKAPAYFGGGRLLGAAELNSLTKACGALLGDYNDDKVDDIAQVQGVIAPSRVVPVDRERLESFSYFIELDSAWVEGRALTIHERSRCEASFPLRYQPDAGSPPTDQYTLANDKPYWRSCARNRDPLYDEGSKLPGYDFGQYDCDAKTLSCPLVAPAHTTRIAPVDPRVDLFRDHGLCRMTGLPADGLWRGMNHHSQFKCVNVTTGMAPDPWDRLSTSFGNANGELTLNRCAARDCSPAGSLSDTNCSSPQGLQGTSQTRQPVIDCTAQAGQAAVGAVGFAAVNYRPYRFASTGGGAEDYSPYNFYRGGCVNEDDAWWSFLCANPEFTLIKALADAQFGRYSCYKYGSNFMWAGPLPDGGTNANDRSTLRWGSTDGGSVLGPRPPPDGGL